MHKVEAPLVKMPALSKEELISFIILSKTLSILLGLSIKKWELMNIIYISTKHG